MKRKRMKRKKMKRKKMKRSTTKKRKRSMIKKLNFQWALFKPNLKSSLKLSILDSLKCQQINCRREAKKANDHSNHLPKSYLNDPLDLTNLHLQERRWNS